MKGFEVQCRNAAVDARRLFADVVCGCAKGKWICGVCLQMWAGAFGWFDGDGAVWSLHQFSQGIALSLAVRDGQAMNSHSATTQLPCPSYSVWVRRDIEALCFAHAVRRVRICPLGDLICSHHSHDWRLPPLLRPLAVPVSSVFTQPILLKNSHPRSLKISCGFICAERKYCST